MSVGVTIMFLRSIFVLFLVLLSQKYALAISSVGKTPGLTKSSKAYSILEWNPADLSSDRVRVNGEYLIFDGFAFGVSTEYQREEKDHWRKTLGGVGVSATQYLQSQSLDGLFIKGEAGLFGAVYEERLEETESGNLFGVQLEASGGYRFRLADRVTGAAAYGVRRYMPGFFQFDDSDVPAAYKRNTRLWEPRVVLSLGIAI